MISLFSLLAKLKFLRGGPLDIFGRTAERRTERKLIDEYFATVQQLLETLTESNYSIAVEIAKIPEQIRGFGHVKEEHIKRALVHRNELMVALRTTQEERKVA